MIDAFEQGSVNIQTEPKSAKTAGKQLQCKNAVFSHFNVLHSQNKHIAVTCCNAISAEQIAVHHCMQANIALSLPRGCKAGGMALLPKTLSD